MNLSPSHHISRIKNAALRVPLWSLWYPVSLARCVVTAVLAGEGRRLLTAAFWHVAAGAFVLGIDGL